MRIVFVGTVEFSRRCLEEVVSAGGDVVGVLTLPPERGGVHGDYADLAPVADAHGLPLHRIGDVNDPETLALVRSLRPDLILVLGWSQLLGAELLSIAPCIGSHPALLPSGRGRHPLTWALVDGLEETGLTFFWLDEGADSGDILWQRAVRIAADDDAACLYEKVERLAGEAIREFLPQLEAGSAPRVPQDAGGATYRRRRTDADRWIDWRLPSKTVYDLVRGLARPYVGALTRRAGQDVLVWRARLPREPLGAAEREAVPGAVLADGPEPSVRTGDGYLILVDLEPADALRAGDVLEGPA